jgi:hypothetical protein
LNASFSVSENRVDAERFIDTALRIGVTPFKDFVYATPISTVLHTGEDAGTQSVTERKHDA